MSTPPPPLPPAQAAALNELRTLGRQLDRQVAHRAGATDHEIDTVLRRMKQVHTGIVTGLHHTT
ncbi:MULTISPECIES: hypothetical protein [Kitasatospora]|uniref:hypothetical protein n=1 Tax=Kitasatospora TaxID=2063 RepID=UPI000C70CE63|nr:hypothetical protein [Kitasatospora sp. GP30]MDH6138790.1 hypothetical protein [Kitasatospora sp. GP30]